MKSFKRIILLCLAFTLLFSSVASAQEEHFYAFVNEAINFISDYYKFEVSTETLKDAALKELTENREADLEDVLTAILSVLDENSSYLTKKQYEDFYTDNISGVMCGIGVRIREVNGRVVVNDTISNSPAKKAGVMPNDIIIGVNGENVEGKSIEEVQSLVMGEEGTSVSVTFLRGEEKVTLEITRAKIENSYVEYEIIDGIGYIYISTFNETILQDVNKALAEFSEKKVEKIILDLRNNTGGSMDAALDICDVFAPKGVIGRIEYNSKNSDSNGLYYSETEGAGYKMAILINGLSASASELVAGTLSDTSVAKLFGTKSYGKGTVQALRPLVTGGAMRLTMAEYKTAGGRSIHKVGINPDFYVENTYENIDDSAFEAMELTKTFKNGDLGKGVLAIEQRLEALGYMEESDETFDEKTLDAVKTFQAYLGLYATGVADAYTLVRLNDIEYTELEVMIDNQLFAALDYLKGLE